ncbi:MAG: helix-turn-helix transcriptional regulator [Candidatus Marinimicrobia bacterium]|nr:helix-turn-helix transcriptional regulator [Candidatus Neomarinimicrobiota bacterium]
MNNKSANPGLGNRLRAIRQYLGESQTVFANRFGLNRGNIDSYEGSRADLPTRLIGWLIELNVNVEWLILGRGNMFNPDRRRCADDKYISNDELDVRLEFWKAKCRLLRLSLALARQRIFENLGPEEVERIFGDLEE